MLTKQNRFEAIQHTADVGYKLFAVTRAELFAVAAAALFDAITHLDTIKESISHRLEIEADDNEALLVQWLSELNFMSITRLEIYGRFQIEEISETHLRAQVWGEPIDLNRHEINTEIKAVTYHGLYLKQEQNGWEAQVIFDV